MTSLLQLGPIADDGLVVWLLEVAAKGFAVLTVATLACLLLSRAPAAMRHLCWSIAIVAVLMLPFFTAALPTWTLPVLPAGWLQSEQTVSSDAAPSSAADATTWAVAPPAAPDATPSAVDPAAAPDATPSAVAPAAAPDATPAPELQPVPTSAAPTLVSSNTPALGVTGGLSWPALLLIVWLMGVALILLHMIAGIAGVWRIVTSGRPILDPAWVDLVDEISERLDIRRPVQLLRCSSVSVPMVWGALRPVVLLPESSDDWDDEKRRCVLAHEMAHVKRLDPLTQPFARVACALHWFNPLVWRAAHNMQLEREKACDDYVLYAARTKASNYATHLLDIARQIPSAFSSPVAAVAMARRSQLEGRVLSILEDRKERSMPKAYVIATLFFAGLLIIPLAALRPVEKPVLAESAADLIGSKLADVKSVLADAGLGVSEKLGMTSQAKKADSSPVSGADVVHRSFNVTPGGWLRIDTDRGNIEVTTGGSNTVEVDVHREARGNASEDDFEVSFEQSGNSIEISGESRERNWGRNNVNVKFVVRLPSKFNVELETSGGNVSVEDLDGEANVETAGGNLSFGRVTGKINAETAGGNISVEGSQGDVNVETSGGGIKLGRVGGKVEASTSGGNISVDGSEGDLKVETSGGNIHLGRVGGTVEASTSGGNIHVEEVNGQIEAETSGGSITARMASQPAGDSRLETGGGSITVYLADDIRVDVDADANGGRVESDIPVESRGNLRKDRLQGTINGGGPALILQGDRVSIRRL